MFQLRQESLKDQTLATPHLVVQMLNARIEMELLPADASKTTLGTPTLHVDLSALSMRTAPLTRHAQDFTVWIRVLGFVAPMLSAGLSTTSPPALASKVMKEIPFLPADCARYVSMKIYIHYSYNLLHSN